MGLGNGLSMRRLNAVSTVGLIVLSLTAFLPLLVVAVPVMLGGQLPPRERDEGTGAHIFQLSIAALLPAGLLFVATADDRSASGIPHRRGDPGVCHPLLLRTSHLGSRALAHSDDVHVCAASGSTCIEP
jgi:hypothetical protein